MHEFEFEARGELDVSDVEFAIAQRPVLQVRFGQRAEQGGGRGEQSGDDGQTFPHIVSGGL